MKLRVGTRRSPLAQAQTDRVLANLPPGCAEKILVESDGDIDTTSPLSRLERPGAFTSVLTDAILDGRIDAAVHSLKDLPLAQPEAAPLVAILGRDDAADVLVMRDEAADASRPLGLRAGSLVGTSAPRRQSQVLEADPELVAVDVRGNVGTRLRLVAHGVVDGLLMAAAAFERMTLPLPPNTTRLRLDPQHFPTGPGQGAIAVQARADSDAARLMGALDDAETRQAVTLERGLLAAMGGGCGMPLGAHASRHGGAWRLVATMAGEGWEQAASPVLARVEATGKGAVAKAHGRLLESLRMPSAARPAAPARGDVLVTLEQAAMAPYAAALEANGWRAHAWPLVETHETADAPPTGADEAPWVAVTSPRAVAPLSAFLRHRGGAPPRMAAVGPATVRALRAHGLPAHVVARDGTGAGLAQAIAAFPAPPAPVLVPQAKRPAGGLMEGLAKAGFEPLIWSVYDTRPRLPTPPPPAKLPVDAIVFTSPSHVAAFVASGHSANAARRFVAFGPTTARAMREASLPVDAEATRRTPGGLAEVMP